jgi:hypothetical protein
MLWQFRHAPCTHPLSVKEHRVSTIALFVFGQ